MRYLLLVTAAIALLGLGTLSLAVTIETVAIGDKGNAADPLTGYGAVKDSNGVAYNYNIGKYEVTAEQYTAFLNAKANVSDAYGLYNGMMWNDIDYGCKIQQTSVTGGYSYNVASAYANRPVNYVSFWDSLRFANWLNNGQGSGSTEIGAYTINGYNGIDGRDIGRNAGATWALTSEDEWYKAAYYKNGAYSLYANGTSVAPGMETDSNYGGTDGIYSTTWDGTIHGVFEQNGTKDMMGNVWELNEAIPYIDVNYAVRGLRGGSFNVYDDILQSAYRYSYDPNIGSYGIGFRVSQVVPEPSSIIALLGGFTGLIGLRRRMA